MTANGQPGKQQYLSDEVFDARYFKALDRFDIRWALTMWVYDNVRAGSQVLHVGCGAGTLALLKRRGVTLTGVDASWELAQTARRNGYDSTFQAAPGSLPFDDGTFDYVASFGVLDALSEAEAQILLAETKRVLRRDGITLHSIQCSDTITDSDHTARFLQVFQHVGIESRYGFCMSAEDFLDAERQELSLETDFLDYLRGLSLKERRAFDLAMGYVCSRVSDLGVSVPPGFPQVLLKASDAPLGPFHNEHRDRRSLFSSPGTGRTKNGLCLDRCSEAMFDEGWFQPSVLPPVARWMGRLGRIRFRADQVTAINLDLTTEAPDLAAQPLGIELALNGVKLCAFTLYKYGWLQLSMPVPEALSSKSNGEFELELRSNRAAKEPRGDRELSVAVCNIEVMSEPPAVAGG